MKKLEALLLGPFPDAKRKVNPALERQWEHVLAVWNNETNATFGVERLFRLFLVLSTWVFPGIYLRHWSGKRWGMIGRKMVLDIYVFAKLCFPLACLRLHLQDCFMMQLVVGYLAMETVLYAAGLLFLSDVYRAPISPKRSYLLFMVNYVEIALDFAVLYSGLHLLSRSIGGLDAVYFSFVTGFTIGYGDVYAASSLGKILVITQSLCSLFFLTVAVTKAVNGFENNTATPTKPRV